MEKKLKRIVACFGIICDVILPQTYFVYESDKYIIYLYTF